MKTSKKSEALKAAWKLYKTYTLTWSEALTKAWKCIKDGVNVYFRKLYSGKEVIGFSKEGIHGSSSEEVIEKSLNSKPFDNSGAAKYYDGKTLNLD